MAKSRTFDQLKDVSFSQMTAREENVWLEGTAMAFLQANVVPGTDVYASVLHVSKSGMARDIALYVVLDCEDGQGNRKPEIVDISGYVARVLGYRRTDRNGGIRVSGCGMDMGFHLVHCLSYKLHGYHDVNVSEDKRGRPHRPSTTSYRAGYSLNHRSL